MDGEPFYAPSQWLIEHHVKYVHSQESSFQIKSNQPLWSCVFSNWRTYQNHLLMYSCYNTVEANSEELIDFEINNTGADSSSTQLDTFEANNSPTDDLEISGTCN